MRFQEGISSRVLLDDRIARLKTKPVSNTIKTTDLCTRYIIQAVRLAKEAKCIGGGVELANKHMVRVVF